MQHRLFGVDTNIRVVFHQMRNIIDAFRQLQFQGEDLDWDKLHARTQSAVEKCNRSCKGVTKPPRVQDQSPHEPAIVEMAISFPRFASPRFCPSAVTQHGLASLHKARLVQEIVQTYALPCNIAYRQSQAVMLSMRSDALSTSNACFVHVCILCSHRVPDKSLRVGAHGIVCSTCQKSDYIVKINLLSRIVRVRQRKFYQLSC